MSGAAAESLLLQSPHVDFVEAVFRHARLQVLPSCRNTTITPRAVLHQHAGHSYTVFDIIMHRQSRDPLNHLGQFHLSPQDLTVEHLHLNSESLNPTVTSICFADSICITLSA